MRILLFLLAVAATGVSCLYNLGEGFVSSPTWNTFGISFLVFTLWGLWLLAVMLRSRRPKRVAAVLSVIFMLILGGLLLYAKWESMADRGNLLGGLSLSCGLFLGLPFIGFAKLFKNMALNRYHFMIPYIIFTVFVWILCVYSIIKGIPEKNREREAARLAKKMKRRERRSKSKHRRAEKPSVPAGSEEYIKKETK